MLHAIELRFAGDHPTAAGHFPGNPIIPGALLLDAVVAACIPEIGERTVSIRSAKFLHPIRPGDALRLQWRDTGDGLIRFECRLIDGDVLGASGALQLQ